MAGIGECSCDNEEYMISLNVTLHCLAVRSLPYAQIKLGKSSFLLHVMSMVIFTVLVLLLMVVKGRSIPSRAGFVNIDPVSNTSNINPKKAGDENDAA